MADPDQLPNSLWAATAVPAPATARLDGETEADVVVVGGGYSGLSAALHLAEKGARVAVLEAREIGWGASGRAFGLVVPGLKQDPDRVEAALGKERGARLVALSGAAPAYVFELIRRHRMRCEVFDKGWIQPAHSSGTLRAIEGRCEQWARRGADVAMIPTSDLPRILGTRAYLGAWIDRRGGHLQPMSYCRELARAALAAGARVFTHSPVTALERRQGRWRATTPAGAVAAERAIVATNAYSDALVPGLARSVVPVRSHAVATRPLGANRARAVLPGGEGVSDAKRVLWAFRVTADGRLAMSGSKPSAGDEKPAFFARLHRLAAELFPDLGRLEWEYGWSGYFAVTPDHLPHLHEPAPGLLAGLGCNGRGIAMATVIGRVLAERALGRPEGEPELPVTPIRPIPFHGLRVPGVAIAAWVKRGLDRL